MPRPELSNALAVLLVCSAACIPGCTRARSEAAAAQSQTPAAESASKLSVRVPSGLSSSSKVVRATGLIQAQKWQSIERRN